MICRICKEKVGQKEIDDGVVLDLGEEGLVHTRHKLTDTYRAMVRGKGVVVSQGEKDVPSS